MPKGYRKADASEMESLTKIRNEHHEELRDHDVQVGLLFARAGRDQHGEATSHPIKFAGVPVVARVRRTSVKERIWCPYDAVIEVDEDRWEGMSEDERVAVIDHELTHVVVAKDKAGAAIIGDDLRPQIAMRPDDWMLTGFAEVVKRHGRAAIEAQAIHEISEKFGQLIFDFAGA